MNILFICRSFHNVAGGIENMATILMNEMVARGHNVSLLTWDQAGAESFYTLDPAIAWHKLDMGNPLERAGWRQRLKRRGRFRSLVRESKPDVILAFQHGIFLSARLYIMGMGIPVIAAERNAPARFDHTKAGRYRNAVFQSFRLADRITIQCESYRQGYPAYLHPRIVTIPNPVFAARRFAHPAEDTDKKILLSVGRLGYQKNYQVLVEAFSRIAPELPDWQLQIIGDGEDRSELERIIADKGLNDRVQLIGTVKNVEEYYCRSHLFCLSSRWEGFPNALAEAMAHGLPAVGFAECAGVRDLITDGQNGLLAPGNKDPRSLSLALKQLMNAPDERDRMGKAAVESVKPYDPQTIFDHWESLLKNTATTGKA